MADTTYSGTKPIEGQEQQQRNALQRRAQQQGAYAAYAVANRSRDQTTDDAAGQHQRQHFSATRSAKP
jgi:hypothetical protein